MGIEDLFLPAYICIGSDVHIIARIGEFNEDTGIFLLTPVLVTERQVETVLIGSPQAPLFKYLNIENGQLV